MLKEFKNIKGYYPLYNEIEFNIKCIDYDLINFCKNNNILIYGYCLFRRGTVFKEYKYTASDYILFANNHNVIPVLGIKNKYEYNEINKEPINIIKDTRIYNKLCLINN